MKKDFRSFKKSQGTLSEEKASEIFENFDESTKREAKTIESVLKQYEGKSQGELMSEITRLADKERKKGSLDNSKLDSFAKNVAPMLNNEQQQRLSDILGQLKQ